MLKVSYLPVIDTLGNRRYEGQTEKAFEDKLRSVVPNARREIGVNEWEAEASVRKRNE